MNEKMKIKENYGTVLYNSIEIKLLNQAHMTNAPAPGEIIYQTLGQDNDGNMYVISWDVYPDFYDHKYDGDRCCICGYNCIYDDEDSICDWSKYTVRQLD